MKQIKIIVILSFLLISLLACTKEFSKEQAESIGISFVNERIKFYVTDNATGQKVIESYSIDSIDTYQETRFWNVIMHISKDGKKSDIALKVDPTSSKVVELNGQVVR